MLSNIAHDFQSMTAVALLPGLVSCFLFMPCGCW